MTALARIAEFTARGCSVTEPLLRARATEAVTDVFGCILAGAYSDVAIKARSAFREIGSGDVPVFGARETLSAAFAAMANAIAGHANDLDDWEEPGNTHPSIVMVPALLAASALNPVDGDRFLTAYATGFEVIARLGEAVTLEHYARGFHSTATLGAIGAAAAVSHLRGLDSERTGHALALSVSQGIGYTCQFGSNAKPSQAGFAAKAGLLSALMAEAGMTGQPTALDAASGMNGLLGAGDEDTFGKALAKLGRPPALLEYGLVLKPWPSCGYTHRLMTCALGLRNGGGLDATNISGVKATMPDFHKAILPFARPQTRNEALFSVESCTAHALLHGNLGLGDLGTHFWARPDTARLAERVEVTTEAPLNPELNYDPAQPDRLSIELASGETLHSECAYPLGAPQNPLSRAQLAAKFTDITGHDGSTFDAVMTWPEANDIALHFQQLGEIS